VRRYFLPSRRLITGRRRPAKRGTNRQKIPTLRISKRATKEEPLVVRAGAICDRSATDEFTIVVDIGVHVEEKIAAADNNTVVSGLESNKGTQIPEGETRVNTRFESFGGDLPSGLESRVIPVSSAQSSVLSSLNIRPKSGTGDPDSNRLKKSEQNISKSQQPHQSNIHWLLNNDSE
jgi:hypothetical protein